MKNNTKNKDEKYTQLPTLGYPALIIMGGLTFIGFITLLSAEKQWVAEFFGIMFVGLLITAIVKK